jgi:hypothetical protein
LAAARPAFPRRRAGRNGTAQGQAAGRVTGDSSEPGLLPAQGSDPGSVPGIDA